MINRLVKLCHFYIKSLVRRFKVWQLAAIITAIIVTVALSPGLLRAIPGYFIPLGQLSRMAGLARQEGDNRTALRLYQTISNRASEMDFSSNYELGNLYSKMGKWNLAERYYLKAASNPAAPGSVFYQLSDLYLKHLPNKGDRFVALIFAKMEDERKGDSGLAVILAAYYRELGDKKNALLWFKQAASLEPDDAEINSAIEELEAK